MLKHVVLIRVGLSGVSLDSHACVKWLYPKADPESSRALLQLLGVEQLPKEIVKFVRDAMYMELRGRFQSNARLAIIDDETEALSTAEEMERYLKTCSRRELERLFGTKEQIHGRRAER